MLICVKFYDGKNYFIICVLNTSKKSEVRYKKKQLFNLELLNLNAKDYILKLELADYQIIESRVSVQYSENTPLKYDLEPYFVCQG